MKHDVSNRNWLVWQVIPNTLSAFGHIDILINNAGISIATPFEDQLKRFGIKVISLISIVWCWGCKAVLPFMKEKGGSIVNVSSIATLTGMAGAGVYTASKGGVSALTRAASWLWTMGIQVNAINQDIF